MKETSVTLDVQLLTGLLLKYKTRNRFSSQHEQTKQTSSVLETP